MINQTQMSLNNGDALVIIDLQNDFLPNGTLAVPEGNEIISVINHYIAKFYALDLPIIATRDWHPLDHQSFVDQGGPWPPHCLAGTHGAQFASLLSLPESTHVISKGVHANCDGYSGFENTSLKDLLEHLKVKRLFIAGLATDYCVAATVCDALRYGYQVIVLDDAIKAVNINPNDEIQAKQKMLDSGAEFITLEYLL